MPNLITGTSLPRNVVRLSSLLWRHLKKKEQLHEFLSRLLTPGEFIMIGRRLQIAEELVRGHSYYTVRDKLKVGFSTIQSVDSWLTHTVRDYHEIRAQQRRQEDAQKKRKRRPTYRTYRIHPAFMLVDLLTQAYAVSQLKRRKSKTSD